MKMNELPLVSIVIPVFNGSKFVAEAIESALDQSYKNIEVIVINDGSSDGGKTESIVKRYEPTVKIISKSNNGVASALNIGIKEASGKYISWLSHDDIYLKNKIEAQINFIKKKNLGNQKVIVFSHYSYINEDGDVIIPPKKHSFRKDLILFELMRKRFISGCSLLMKKNMFEDLGYFNESLKTSQDYDLWFRAIKNGYDFRYLPIHSVKMRIHKGQTSNLLNEQSLKEKDNLFFRTLEWMPIQKSKTPRVVMSLRYALLGMSLFRQSSYNAYCKAIEKSLSALFIKILTKDFIVRVVKKIEKMPLQFIRNKVTE